MEPRSEKKGRFSIRKLEDRIAPTGMGNLLPNLCNGGNPLGGISAAAAVQSTNHGLMIDGNVNALGANVSVWATVPTKIGCP